LQEQQYKFAGFVLKPGQRQLLCPGGNSARLSAKAFDTLLYLVRRSGETLSKEDLLAAIWSDSRVEENSLVKAVSSLRQALGQTPGGKQYIVTIPGRGYQFVAPVEVDALPNAPTTALLQQPSIAFLPLDNLTGTVAHDVTVDSLTEDLTTAVADNPAYHVAARNSSFKYKDRFVDAREVGHDLGVDYVVEGSLQTTHEGLRLTIQLIETANGAHVWTYHISSVNGSSDAFRREIGVAGTGLTLFLQGALLRHYVARIGSEDPAILIEKLAPETLVMVAFCGIYGRDDVTEAEMKSAWQLLDKAVQLCPHNVYALAAYGYSLVGIPSVSTFETEASEAKARYDRAFVLFDHMLSVGDGAIAINNLACGGFWVTGHWKRARPLIERGLHDFPYPMVLIHAAQWRLFVEGKVDETITALGQVLASETNQTQIEQYNFTLLIGVAHLVRGAWDAAIVSLEHATAIAPRTDGALGALIAGYVLCGNVAEAQHLTGRFRSRHPDGLLHDTPFRRACLHPHRSGIDPTAPVGRMICVTIPDALRRVGLEWALPPEDASAPQSP
jgi:DNA-binding winged helix-turn-helix (wHTH) protein